jgi:hypothetical protein
MSPTPSPEPVAAAPSTSISATPAKPTVPTTTNATATVTTPGPTKQLQPPVQLSETPASASPDPGTSAGSSPDPSVASGSHNESPQKGKKRAYEEATPDEKYGLYQYTEANPNMKQVCSSIVLYICITWTSWTLRRVEMIRHEAPPSFKIQHSMKLDEASHVHNFYMRTQLTSPSVNTPNGSTQPTAKKSTNPPSPVNSKSSKRTPQP